MASLAKFEVEVGVRNSRFMPVALLVLLMAIWGYSWVPGKLGVENSSAFIFASLRTFPGALVLLALLPLTGRPFWPKAVRLTALVGLLQMTGFVAFISAALVSGGAGHSAMLANTWQFWLLILAWWFLGERLRLFQWMAVFLALVGLVLIIEPWGLHGVTSSLLTLAGAVCFAAGAVVAKVMRMREKIDLLSFTAWQALFGSIPLGIVALVAPGGSIKWNVTFAWSMAFSALIGTAFAGVLWLYLLNRLPANTAGIGTIGTPVLGVLFSRLQLGEHLSAYEIGGMVLIVSALALLVLRESIFGKKVGRPLAPVAQPAASGSASRRFTKR